MPCSRHPIVNSGQWGQIHLALRHAHLGPLVEEPCDGLLGIELAHWKRPKLLLQHNTHCQEYDDVDTGQTLVPTLPMMFVGAACVRSGRHHGDNATKQPHVLLKPQIVHTSATQTLTRLLQKNMKQLCRRCQLRRDYKEDKLGLH